MGKAIGSPHDPLTQYAPGTCVGTVGAGSRKCERSPGRSLPPAKNSPRGAPMIRFPLGRVVATPGAFSALEKAEQLPAEFLDRHVNGDWGEVPDADKQENEVAIEQGFRILSGYTTSAGDKLWILTEADRSATILMLPEEY